MMSGPTYTQRLADTISQFGGATAYQAADELLRLEARVAELEAQELAAPPKREPLSEDEIKQIEFTVRTYKREPLDVVAFASAIERAHGIGVQS